MSRAGAGSGLDVLVVGAGGGVVGGDGTAGGIDVVVEACGWLGGCSGTVVVGCAGSDGGGTSAVVLVVRGTRAGVAGT
ncbi:MAG: hypothetical protein M3N28_08530 [Actinomycetota bacterium]|nr:hypothetical protein [Actinomycetota bacterium]